MGDLRGMAGAAPGGRPAVAAPEPRRQVPHRRGQAGPAGVGGEDGAGVLPAGGGELYSPTVARKKGSPPEALTRRRQSPTRMRRVDQERTQCHPPRLRSISGWQPSSMLSASCKVGWPHCPRLETGWSKSPARSRMNLPLSRSFSSDERFAQQIDPAKPFNPGRDAAARVFISAPSSRSWPTEREAAPSSSPPPPSSRKSSPSPKKSCVPNTCSPTSQPTRAGTTNSASSGQAGSAVTGGEDGAGHYPQRGGVPLGVHPLRPPVC